MLRDLLRLEGHRIDRSTVFRLVRLMSIEALYRKRRTTRRNSEHKVYPYLLRHLPVVWCNQVWAMDISYIPMPRGFVYLAAVADWHS